MRLCEAPRSLHHKFAASLPPRDPLHLEHIARHRGTNVVDDELGDTYKLARGDAVV